jgi:hypothetical protein
VAGGYRWSISRGALDLGIGFVPRPAAPLPIDARFDSAAPAGWTLPSLSVGLRSVSTAPAPASSLIERALGAPPEVASESKVGIEWKPAASPMLLGQGLGVRLSGDDRVTMRFRKGLLGVYYKRSF